MTWEKGGQGPLPATGFYSLCHGPRLALSPQVEVVQGARAALANLPVKAAAGGPAAPGDPKSPRITMAAYIKHCDLILRLVLPETSGWPVPVPGSP